MAKITKDEIIEVLGQMTVLELNDLVKGIEEKFGVTAAVAVAGPAVAEEKAAAKTSFNVVLKAPGPNKVQVIKAVQAITGLGLMDAKKLVDNVANGPVNIKENVPTADAEDAKSKLLEVGADVELK